MATAKRYAPSARRKLEAGGDGLRSLLTLPSAVVPNIIRPRPQPFFRLGDDPFDPARTVRLELSHTVALRRPHLWAGLGTVVGGLANAHLAGYKLSKFRLRFNSWESEKIAMREQGADLVHHFILGYGLTRFFLDNGSDPVSAGVSAFAYEFVVGEIFESFPQAGGISVRDVAADLVAVAFGMIDHRGDSPLRFWAGSNATINPSAPNEFDPYRIRLGLAVARVAGMEFVCTLENWKDTLPRHPDLDDPNETAQLYYIERL